jgi:hypothetical protein
MPYVFARNQCAKEVCVVSSTSDVSVTKFCDVIKPMHFALLAVFATQQTANGPEDEPLLIAVTVAMMAFLSSSDDRVSPYECTRAQRKDSMMSLAVFLFAGLLVCSTRHRVHHINIETMLIRSSEAQSSSICFSNNHGGVI